MPGDTTAARMLEFGSTNRLQPVAAPSSKLSISTDAGVGVAVAAGAAVGAGVAVVLLSSWIWSSWNEPAPLKGAKLKPHIWRSVSPLLGAPAGCQSVRRVNCDHAMLIVFQPEKLSTTEWTKRSDVSVVLPGVRSSMISTRMLCPVFM